jgi:hypothetical protein
LKLKDRVLRRRDEFLCAQRQWAAGFHPEMVQSPAFKVPILNTKFLVEKGAGLCPNCPRRQRAGVNASTGSDEEPQSAAPKVLAET